MIQAEAKLNQTETLTPFYYDNIKTQVMVVHTVSRDIRTGELFNRRTQFP